MKAIPRVDMNGRYIEDVIVPTEMTGILMAFDWTSLTDGAGNPAGKQIGYDVAIPMIKSLYRPVFQIEKYQANEYTDPSELWVEGMSPEEIKGITKPPQESTIEQKIDELITQQNQMWEFILGG